jgi:CheY-like chemotaxis protein
MLQGLAILVLEDEPVIALTLEDMLLDAGAEPVVAGSLQAADEVLAARQFDAALLDVNVGEASSYKLASKLQARGIPFVFATGYGNALHTPAFTDVPTIAKPYNLSDIEIALASLAD